MSTTSDRIPQSATVKRFDLRTANMVHCNICQGYKWL